MSETAQTVVGGVEDGVQPLALELDRLSGVVVLDSCQGGRDWPAYLVFRGRDRGGLEIAGEVMRALAAHAEQLECELRTTWRPGADLAEAILELTCPAGQVIALALALRAARRGASGGAPAPLRAGCAPARPARRARHLTLV